jgi:peptidoglycan hydrolase CwlO-like protein
MKKSLLVSGLAVSLTLAGLTGCGDGVDQDNGISDGKQNDEVDKGTMQKAEDTINNVEKELKQAQNNLEKKIDDNGVSDGVNQ